MRILALTPTARLEDETASRLLGLRLRAQAGDINGITCFDILLTCENPHEVVPRETGGAGGRPNILLNYQKGRELFLAGGYDLLFILESDIVAPRDVLEKLLAIIEGGADVAYGLYVFRPRKNARVRRLIVNVYERPRAGRNTLEPGQSATIGSSLSLKGARYHDALREGVVPCSGAGLGVVLARREVIERIEFRDKGGRGPDCDSYWNADVWAAGFEQRADMSLVCGHKTPEGEILWPPQTEPWT